MREKIKSLTELQQIIVDLKSKGKKIVHCHGVFDLLHIGHIKHFEEARTFGDVLVVTITLDKFVRKGPNRPAFTTTLRLEALASLESVDYVAENRWPSAIETIKLLKPDIYCKGPDYQNQEMDITGKIKKEEKTILSVGGRMQYTNDLTFSSSNLLNNFGYILNENQKSLINKININYDYKKIKQMIDELKNLKILLLEKLSLINMFFGKL